ATVKSGSRSAWRRPTRDPAAGAAAPAAGSRVGLRQALRDPDFTVALLGQLFYAAPFAALIVFGALFARRDDGLSPSAIQVMFGVFFGVSLLVRLLIAWRSPVRRKLRWFRVSAGLTCLGLLVLATGRGEAALLVAMALLGAPHGLTFPLAMALVAERRPRLELISLNAHLTASVQAVNLILPPVIGIGIDRLGYRPMLLTLLIPVAAAALAQNRVSGRLGAGDPRGRPGDET
ncbi:MAG TPA: MFS transporter, partial [Verrucomicrobiae bacterium]|nr:MFS transporter [Verrucomicrobiae bacterium]